MSVPLVLEQAGPQPNPGPAVKTGRISAGAKSLESQCYYSTVVPITFLIVIVTVNFGDAKLKKELRGGDSQRVVAFQNPLGMGDDTSLEWPTCAAVQSLAK